MLLCLLFCMLQHRHDLIAFVGVCVNACVRVYAVGISGTKRPSQTMLPQIILFGPVYIHSFIHTCMHTYIHKKISTKGCLCTIMAKP